MAELAPIHPSVAMTSPSLYNALQTSGATPEDVAMTEQLSQAYQKGLQLRQLDNHVAQNEYQKLSAAAKADVKVLFPNDSYLTPPPTIVSRIEAPFKWIYGQVTSAISAGIKDMGNYGKALMTVPRVAVEVAGGTVNNGISVQGAAPKKMSLFSAGTWSTAFQGKDLYVESDLDALRAKYGAANIAVATGLVAGKTPGEIMAGYNKGQWDDSLGTALSQSLNNPKQFTEIMDAVKLARFSPGRAVIRKAYNMGEKSGQDESVLSKVIRGTLGNGPLIYRGQGESDAAFKARTNKTWLAYETRASGPLDAVYDVAIDPLTYATGGGSKAGTLSDTLTTTLKNEIAKGNIKGGVAQVFARPEVRDLWDNTVGPAVKKFNEATSPAAKAVARREFALAAPSQNSEELLRTFSRANRGKGVVDANSAQEFFSDAQNTHMLLARRVDGTNYWLNGIATARSNRFISQGVAAAADAFFNPVIGKSSVIKTIEEGDAASKPVLDILKKIGSANENYINPDVEKLASIKQDQKLAFKLGDLWARSPGRGQILYGDEAYKTIDTFQKVARLVLPRDMAEIVARDYLESNASEQLSMVYNLYAAYMYKIGIAGTPKGEDLMQEELSRIFNNIHGMGASGTTELPAHMGRVFSKDTVTWENDVPLIANGGGRLPSQLTDAIGALDYIKLFQYRANLGKVTGLISAFDKATQNAFVRGYTAFWNYFTLNPRIGIRSTADEGFMYFSTAPYADLVNMSSRMTRKTQNFLDAVSGSRESVGPMRTAMNILFRKGGPEKYLTLEKHSQIINDLAERLSKETGNKVNPEDIQHVLIREEVAQRAWNVYVNEITDPIEREAFINAVKYQPDFINGAVNALTARTSLTGKFVEDDHLNPMFEPSSVDKALEDVGQKLFGKGIKTGKKFQNVPERKFNGVETKYPISNERDTPWWHTLDKSQKTKAADSLVALAHFDNYGLGFSYNSMQIGETVGKSGKTIPIMFSPVNAFLSNNALKTEANVENAVKSLMNDIGVKWTDQIDHQVFKPELLSNFVNKFGDTATLRARGLTDVAIARTHIETMLGDMYTRFHGGRDGFNQELFNAIRGHYEDMLIERDAGSKVKPDWSKAAAKIDFPQFEELTNGKHPVLGGVNTRLLFKGVTDDLGSFFSQVGKKTFEMQDRMINNLYRQKALSVVYRRIYKEYKPLQDAFATNLEAAMLEANPWNTMAGKIAADMAAKRYTEIAMSDATSSVLKYADNPEIRSNLTVALHTVGRFYRANEDFQRRVFRMAKDAPLKTLYRYRLLYTGLQASGSVYNDGKNNMYIVAPTDSVLWAPTQWALSNLYPDATDAFKIPQFDEVKLKLELLNPSLSSEAGGFQLAGPMSAISVWAVRSILNDLPAVFQPYGQKAGVAINNAALGSVGANVSIRKAIVPMFLDTLYTALNPKDQTRETVTAAVQATGYLAAYGHGLPANPTAQQQQDYTQNIRLAAHSILVMRALFGQISPATPVLQESKGLPAYYKAVGVTALRPEFYAILQGIKDTYPDNQDPYALATAIFVGKNPGKSIYLTSRSDKNYQVLISATQQMQDWATRNTDFVSKYGDAAYVFAPQIGKFNSNVYNWMQGQDLATLPSIEKYLANASTAQAKADYFGISAAENQALAGNLNLSSRQQIIADAKQLRDSLLASNPLLKGQIGTNLAQSQANDMITYQRIKEVLALDNAPISRQDKVYMTAAVKKMDGFISIVTDPEFVGVSNFSEIKLQQRNETENDLQKLAAVSPAVKEAYQYVFRTIMNMYAPDKNVVLSKGNG